MNPITQKRTNFIEKKLTQDLCVCVCVCVCVLVKNEKRYEAKLGEAVNEERALRKD